MGKIIYRVRQREALIEHKKVLKQTLDFQLGMQQAALNMSQRQTQQPAPVPQQTRAAWPTQGEIALIAAIVLVAYLLTH